MDQIRNQSVKQKTAFNHVTVIYLTLRNWLFSESQE